MLFLLFLDLIMVRVYKRKSQRGDYGEERLAMALEAINQGMPLIRVSKEMGIPARTLRRHRDQRTTMPGVLKLGRHTTTLSVTLERQLHDHIQHMEKSLYGLTPRDVRRLAFDVAEAAGVNHKFCKASKMAGKDWLAGYFSRNPDLSIRTPQGTNLSRAVAFNRPKVQQFFDVYRQLLTDVPCTPSRIWNMDETGITNVQRPSKIIATKGQRTVGKMTSGERGTTVTVICAMSAAGSYLPPMFIYPRKRMVDALLTGAPPQSVGYTSASGWTDSELFIKWLEHFVSFTNASKDNHHIIILDGHHSHKTLSAITFARDNGLHLLTLPPHSTHKMQPLDRTYFKSLKSSYNTSADSWMISHPGKRITFFDMAGIFGTAFLRTATPDKAIHGFKCCGLWPFDSMVFSDDDFQACAVTDEALPVPVPVAEPAGASPVPVADLQPVTSDPAPLPVPVAEPVPVVEPAGATPVPFVDLQPVTSVADAPPSSASIPLNDEEQGRP